MRKKKIRKLAARVADLEERLERVKGVALEMRDHLTSPSRWIPLNKVVLRLDAIETRLTGLESRLTGSGIK